VIAATPHMRVLLSASLSAGTVGAGAIIASSSLHVRLRGVTNIHRHSLDHLSTDPDDGYSEYDTFGSLISAARSWLQNYSPGETWPELFCLNVLSVMLVGFVGLTYQFFKPAYELPKGNEEQGVENLDGKWRYRFFDIKGDKAICLMSCCCPLIRWADTVSMANILGFWVALVLIAFFFVVAEMSSGILSFVVLAVFVLCRQQQRRLFAMNGDAGKWTTRSCTEDCLAYAFCPCCAIIQEARQIEEAHLVGHSVLSKKHLYED